MTAQSDSSEFAAEAARILIDTKSVLFNAETPFVFTSGRLSPVYVDCRRPIGFAAERKRLMDMGAEMLRAHAGPIDIVAGGETAGIPYAAFIADRLDKPMVYVRKKPKGFGRMAQIEGCMDEEGRRVVMVEDLQSEGGSKKLFIDVLRQAGAVVEDTFVVFHYGIFPSSEQNMTALGVRLHALCTWWDVLRQARACNDYDVATLDAIEAFLHDPEGWAQQQAPRHGAP